MLISFFMQLVALWCLSMAMNKHHRLVFNKPLTANKEKIFRLIGWLLLLISYVVIAYQDTAMMSVYWCSYLSFNTLIVVLINTRYLSKKA